MLTPPPRAMRVWGGFWARLPPPQWLDFLERHPNQRAEQAETVEWLPDWLAQLQPIQADCLFIPYEGESTDIWDIADPLTLAPPDTGFDCEDFDLTVRALAHQGIGIPLGALRLAICETTEQHAVLLVSTEHGELVIDNGHVWTEIGPWHEYPCKWLYVWGAPKWGRIMESDMRNAT